MSLFSGTIQQLEKALHYTSVNNQTIANNISNVDTPNYKAKKAVFNDLLKSELTNQFQAKRTDSRHLDFSSEQSSFRIVSNSNTTYNHNGNNVDIDQEMTELAKNQIHYQALVDRINGKFNSLQSVIRGGN
ncbi:flagellar basal body rod protein FlgB [Gracilibacillus alcaliphilus]|uniref:flagellar basal body rod protein FlgB n=1 Tax=Gracilibacillus alcaliphilus TaxID=1401441 RepID=UPI00195D41C9|nr:flagellar basal body rod protein FlgB [Gracilibacillus alcaliphilus]MBM7677928.1 flagellar basal-body rod protein FlgB [Gracilibacillus alcaliphilus]